MDVLAIVALLSVLLMGVALSWWNRRTRSRELASAAAGIARLGRGDRNVRLPSGRARELGVLIDAVNQAAEHLEARAASAEEERRVRELILSSMDDGVMLVAPDGAVGFANPAVERLIGSRVESLAGLHPLTLREAVLGAGSSKVPVSLVVEIGAPTRWLSGTAIPAGEEGAILLVLRDVSEARRLEAVRRDFVTNASHELKTPAASIRAAAETIRAAAADDPAVVPRFARQLEREAIRLSRIVSDLLDLSRLESGSELGELVSLDALLREELTRFEDAAREAGVSMSVRAARTPDVKGSPRDLALLVRNLIDNAIRYTGSGGRVDLGLDTRDGEIVLTVQDTGLGIPSRELPRIFERFYRVDRARSRETGGTGLGLSIVRHVAENHGGRVRVTSELGQGSTFEVSLPSGTSGASAS